VPHRDLKVIEAAENGVLRVNALLDGPLGRRILYVIQMRKSAQSVSSNISEAFGRGEGRERSQYLRIARGEAEETIRHLTSNFHSKRIPPKQYWGLRNLFIVIAKMLSALIQAK
jgi:four helix bundle protein